jgi:hypothetical protein
VQVTVQAYVNYGRWVADCPNPACTNAMAIEPGKDEFRCEFWGGTPQAPRLEGCRTVAEIGWPDDPYGVMADLIDLPEPQRNWRPATVEAQ